LNNTKKRQQEIVAKDTCNNGSLLRHAWFEVRQTYSNKKPKIFTLFKNVQKNDSNAN
jgi:hypothetical protein